MINKARRYGRAFKRNGQLLAVELRRLQEAGAHLTYGRESFGAWAAIEFADLDLSADNANKLSQSGRVILALERNGRVDLEDSRTFPGATGTRVLASLLSTHGEQAAIRVFDACPEGHVVASTTHAAASALLPKAPPSAPIATPDEHDEEEDLEDQPPPEVQQLQASIERIRDLLDELYLAEDIDPVAVKRAYEHLLEDTHALGSVLGAVLPVDGEL